MHNIEFLPTSDISKLIWADSDTDTDIHTIFFFYRNGHQVSPVLELSGTLIVIVYLFFKQT